MLHLVSIFVAATLTHNIALTYLLGMCPFVSLSRSLKTAVGMSVAVIFVITLTAAINWPIYQFLRAHDAVDVGIVASDRIAVACVAVGFWHYDVAQVARHSIVMNRCARAAEDRIRNIRPKEPVVEREQAGATADYIVLSQVTENRVAAAVTFDVVIPIGCRIEGSNDV